MIKTIPKKILLTLTVSSMLAMAPILVSAQTADASGSAISNVMVIKTGTIATISWTTDKLTRGEVYYSTAPFQLTEAVKNHAEPLIGGGISTNPETGLSMGQAITVYNLQPNTLYYYVIEATDSSGNVSVTWPGTFMTTQ